VTDVLNQHTAPATLPPLQSKTAGQSRVRGIPRARLCCLISAGCLLTLPWMGVERSSSRRAAKPGEGLRKVEPGDLLAIDPEVMRLSAIGRSVRRVHARIASSVCNVARVLAVAGAAAAGGMV
jgi:hypothetical protein